MVRLAHPACVINTCHDGKEGVVGSSALSISIEPPALHHAIRSADATGMIPACCHKLERHSLRNARLAIMIGAPTVALPCWAHSTSVILPHRDGEIDRVRRGPAVLVNSPTPRPTVLQEPASHGSSCR